MIVNFLRWFIDFFLHLDKHLGAIIQQYGTGTYALLFAIIFCETGLVVTPFLPGDSLLFAAGTFAAMGALNIVWLAILLFAAAILGDSLNYWIGRRGGELIIQKYDGKLIRRAHVERAHRFYEKHGAKMIVLARFVPIVRTFAPFVAGIAKMSYGTFIYYNIIGGIAWISVFLFSGYFFGRIQIVQQNFSLVVLAIIGVSLLPMVYEVWQARKEKDGGDTTGRS